MGVHVSLLQVKMPPMMEIITAEQLMEYLGERLKLLNLLLSKFMSQHLSKGNISEYGPLLLFFTWLDGENNNRFCNLQKITHL